MDLSYLDAEISAMGLNWIARLRVRASFVALGAGASLLLGPPAFATGSGQGLPADSTHHQDAHDQMPGMSMGDSMAGMEHAHHAAMRGMYGPYPMTRESSGTARRHSFPRDLLPIAWLWSRVRGDHAGPFFTSPQGDHLTRQRAWQIARACALAAGVTTQTGKPVRFHILHHSIGTHLLDARMLLETVADVLRHRSLRSTSCYAVTSLRRRDGYTREIQRSPEIVKVG